MLNGEREERQARQLRALLKHGGPGNGKSKRKFRLNVWQDGAGNQDPAQKQQGAGPKHSGDNHQFGEIPRPPGHGPGEETFPLVFGMIETGHESGLKRDVQRHRQRRPE